VLHRGCNLKEKTEGLEERTEPPHLSLQFCSLIQGLETEANVWVFEIK
jgi:hypothetical protein